VIRCDRCGKDVPEKRVETVTVLGEPWHYCTDCFNRLAAEVRRRGRRSMWRESLRMARMP